MKRWRGWVFALIALLLVLLAYSFMSSSARIAKPAESPAAGETAPAPLPPGSIGREEADVGTRTLPRAPTAPEQR